MLTAGGDASAMTPYPAAGDRIAAPGESVKPLADYLKMFEDYRGTMEEQRRQMETDVNYYHGYQLTRNERLTLSQRGQPDVVINRIRVAVNGLLGVIIHSKADPRCWPRTPNDEDSADVATDTLRYIQQSSRFNRTKAECVWDMLVPGVGAAIIEVDEKGNVSPRQIAWNEFFHDPRSKKRDLSDALYMGIAKWQYASDLKQKYGTEISLAFSSVESVGGPVDETYQDRPLNQGGWLDIRNRRVMVVEMYHRFDGDWYKCVYYGGGVLEEAISPFVDDKGRSVCPIEAMTAYLDFDNQRYGIVRDMRDIQDEINKRRSKLLHIINSHQIQARDPSAIEVDADTARKEAARPDGVIPYGWEVVRTTDMSAGQMQLLAEAKNEMERMGPNPAVLGRQGSDTSGRAILARQQAGLTEMALVIDQIDDWELRIYHQCWWRARQFWKDPQWIRVSDDPDTPKFVQLNKPRGPVIGAYPERADDGSPHPQAGQPVHGPAMYHPETLEDGSENPVKGHSVFGYDNDLGEMDIDIIVDTQPETANIMQEMLQDLIKLVAASPTYAEQVPFDLFLELSPIPHKRMVMDKLKQFQAGKAQADAQEQQQKMAAALAKLEAEVIEMKSKAYYNIAFAESMMVKSGVEQQQALTASAEAATYAGEALHGAIDQHVAGEQAQQQLDQQPPPEPPASGPQGA